MSDLVLGCAQLGLDYGIANASGKPTQYQVDELVATALANGIDTFDTAQAYGDSEEVIGQALSNLAVQNTARMITKLSPDLDTKNADLVRESVLTSLGKLGLGIIDGLMFHRAEMLDDFDGVLGKELMALRGRNKIKHLGVSVYTVEEATRAIRHPEMDYVQIPANAWDQRMIKAGVFALAEENNTTLFIRSIFLQGLLLMELNKVAEKLPFAVAAAEEWEKIAVELPMSKHALALAVGKKFACPLVLGAEQPGQIKENVEIFQDADLSESAYEEINSRMGKVVNERILNPAMWC